MNAREIGRMVTGSLARLVGEVSVLRQLQYSPILAQVIVTRRCNIACRYCNEFDKQSSPVPVADVLARIDRLNELGTLAIEFSGGEPLLHPHLVEIISYATAKKFYRRMLISNGLLLTREIIEGLNAAGLQHLQISVDGVKENAITTKVLNNLRPQLELLRKHRKFAVTVNSVVGAAPAEETEEVYAFNKANGFNSRVLVVHDHTGQAALTKAQRVLYSRLTADITRQKASGRFTEKLLTGEVVPFKCRAGARYLYVDECGMVRWCSQQRRRYGKPLGQFTVADLCENFYSPKACSDRCSLGCARSCSALDQWRRQDDTEAVR
nr:radical SAM protein [uncultured Desulfobulbus sp.]